MSSIGFRNRGEKMLELSQKFSKIILNKGETDIAYGKFFREKILNDLKSEQENLFFHKFEFPEVSTFQYKSYFQNMNDDEKEKYIDNFIELKIKENPLYIMYSDGVFLKHYFDEYNQNPIELYLLLSAARERAFDELKTLQLLKWDTEMYDDRYSNWYSEDLPQNFPHGIDNVIRNYYPYLAEVKVTESHFQELKLKYFPNSNQNETLQTIIKHDEADEIVELLRKHCKNQKGKDLEILRMVLLELNLIDDNLNGFWRACKNTFKWDVGGETAMSNYRNKIEFALPNGDISKEGEQGNRLLLLLKKYDNS